jgi:hypothetical protein
LFHKPYKHSTAKIEFADLSSKTIADAGERKMRGRIIIVLASVLLIFAAAPLLCSLAYAQSQYSVTIWGWDYDKGWLNDLPVFKDGVFSGFYTPTTFIDLTGTHTFTAPIVDSQGHPFSDWDVGGSNWTDPTITVSSGGTYTARYRAGYSVTIWGWDYIDAWGRPVPITKDGAPTGFSTPHTFTDLTGIHTFSVPYTNSAGHQFSDWSNDWTDPTLTVSSAGVYTARYREGYSVTIRALCASEGWVARPINIDGSYTGYSTTRTFYLIGTHTIEVPNYDESGHTFYGWNEGTSSSPTLTVSSSGVFTAKYASLPEGSMSINNGAEYTSSATVNLMLTVIANTFVGPLADARWRVSNDGVWDTEPWHPLSENIPWTLTPGDGGKTVYYQLKDTTGLISQTYSESIILDTTPPSMSFVINGDGAYTKETLVILHVTSSDALSGPGAYRWSGDGVWDSESWIMGFDTDWWDWWNFTSGDGTKTLYLQIKDRAGNLSPTYSDSIILDTFAPRGHVMISTSSVPPFEDAPYTSSTSVTVYWTMISVGVSDLSQVRYSNDGVWDTEQWENWVPSTPPAKAWTLTPGDGTKTVYCQLKSNSGMVSSMVISDSIMLDTAPPTGAITINSGAASTSSTSATLTLTYADALSDVSQVRYSNDGVSWTAWEAPAATKAWTLTAGDGTKTVYYQIKDNAGLTSTTYTDTITLQTGGSEWNIQNVDSTGSATSLALDSYGNPHISYSGGTAGALKYAKWTGSTWSIQTVDPNGGIHSSLALDSNNNPCISYYWLGDVKFARWNGSAWNIQTVDSMATVDSSLALDASGYPCISYNSYSPATGNSLKLARWTGSGWNLQNVGPQWGYHPSLILDSNGYPCISYGPSLTLARWIGSEWNIQTVGPTTVVHSSIALDASGHPCISYYEISTESLKFARWNGAAWSIQTVDLVGSAGMDGPYNSIAIDSNNNPCISYYKGTTSDLKFARWTGSEWNIQIVDSAGNVGAYSSLALDSSGHPCISYDDYTNGYLKYAQGQSAPPTDTTPPTGSVAINGNATTTNSASVVLTISATDPESSVTQMRFSNDGSSWTNWEAYATSKSWTLTSSDGAKTVYVQFKNGAGLTSTSYQDSITLQSSSSDTTPPTGSITINGGAATTNSVSVTLTLSATDNSGTVAQMRFANMGESWTTWELYATSKIWTLPSGTGEKTVLAQFKDGSGIESAPYGDTITVEQYYEERTFNVTIGTNVYTVTTRGNSSTSDFSFNQVLKRIRFNTNGTSGTTCLCNITIPATLMSGNFSLFIDDTQLAPNAGYTQTYNGTHYTLSMNHAIGSHTAEIFATNVIPEFPPTAAPSLFLILASGLALGLRGKLERKRTLQRDLSLKST